VMDKELKSDIQSVEEVEDMMVHVDILLRDIEHLVAWCIECLVMDSIEQGNSILDCRYCSESGMDTYGKKQIKNEGKEINNKR